MVIHFSSPALNFSSVSVLRLIVEASSLDTLEVFVAGNGGGVRNMVLWIIVESLAGSYVGGMCPSHEIMWL